jgi:hypothetical protein
MSRLTLVRTATVRLVTTFAAVSFGIAALAPVPAAAGAPTFQRNIAIDDTNLLGNTSRQCGFDVYLRQIGILNLKFMVRANGVLTIQEIGGGGPGMGIYFAPSTGKSVTVNVDDAGTNIETDYPDGSVTIMNAGTDGVITVPGYGHVYIGVGRVVVTVDPSGNVTEVSVGARDPDHSGVCPLLR